MAETRGNPLALLELPRGLTHAELAGGFELSGSHGLSGIDVLPGPIEHYRDTGVVDSWYGSSLS